MNNNVTLTTSIVIDKLLVSSTPRLYRRVRFHWKQNKTIDADHFGIVVYADLPLSRCTARRQASFIGKTMDVFNQTRRVHTVLFVHGQQDTVLSCDVVQRLSDD